MKTISFGELEMASGGGDFLKFPPNETQHVYILAGPALIPNKFNPQVPKPACAVWNAKESKIQVMDIKSAVLDVLKLLDAEKADWSKTMLKINRKGSGKEDTTYTTLPCPTAALAEYDKRQQEGATLLAKLSVTKSAKPVPTDESPY